MRIIKLMPKANEDLEGIWYYSYHHFGEPQADRYVEHLSDVLQILSNNNIRILNQNQDATRHLHWS